MRTENRHRPTSGRHRSRWPLLVASFATAAVGCIDEGASSSAVTPATSDSFVPLSLTKPGEAAPLSSADTREEEAALSPEVRAQPDGPLLGAVHFMVSVYERPDHRATKIGYLRVGMKVPRGQKPAAFDSCAKGFYNIQPHGFVCLDDGATVDMEHPILKAEIHQADRSKPLPYHYGFIRAIAPRYYRLPSVDEQIKYEMSLKRHLRSFRRLKDKWNAIAVGSNDVRILPDGVVLGPPPADPPELNSFEKFGGTDGAIPWFFKGGRQIPNVANFKVPEYAVITNRIKRHAGVSLIGAMAGEERDFALTADLRLIPISKLKPARGSVFHGVELTEGWELPVAFVKRRGPDEKGVREYRKTGGRFKRTSKRIAYGTPIQLTGEVHRDGKRRYVETELGTWLRTFDLAIAPLSSKLPRVSKRKQKWVDVSIQRQTLILYEGTKPVYATMVSTGKDGLGDPRKSHSTPRGLFRIRDKHVTTTMDSQVVGEEFELQDVPYVQYFKAGYALHAAYWHTEFGRPRSHGCINLAPLDAYRIFHWTKPHVPDRWHSGAASPLLGEGTYVYVHP
ncbi:MAG: L,D-transpeptidase [Myxococcota bacterium]